MTLTSRCINRGVVTCGIGVYRKGIHHVKSLVFIEISIHHAMSLTGTGVKIISENEIILITDGRLHKSI